MKFWSRAVLAAAVAFVLSAGAVSAASPTPGPSRPSSLKATAGDTRVSLSWVQPTLHNPPIANYTITGSPGFSATTTNTSYVATGLKNGTLYTFTVKATNTDGVTGPSSVAATATPRAIPPDRPRNVAATPGPADGQTTLSWTPPASNGSLPDGNTANIDHYNVTVSPGGISQQVPQSTTTFVAATPADNITYTFTVSATNNRPLTGAAGVAYSPVPTAASLGLNPTAGRVTTSITVTGQLFLRNENITLYWDDPSHVAASVVTDDNGAFTKTVKPFQSDKPKVHKLCASVQPKPCANFTLQAPPTPSPKVTPTPVESPSPSPGESPQASGARTGGGGGLSGLDIITRPPFVFLPIIGILGLLGVLAFWALSGRRRRPPAPAAATVVHRATRPDYTTPFPPARTPGAPVPPPAVAPPGGAQPPIPGQPPAQPAWQAPVSPAPQAQPQPPPPAPQPPAAPPAAPQAPPPAAPPAPVEWPAPPPWAATPDEPPDLPQPSD